MNPTVQAFRQVQFAINLAGVAHNKQLDKAGEPYLWHVLRVGIGLLPDVDACLLGILHDVLEDSTCPRDALLTALGDVELYQDLLALTRHESETYDHYIARIQTRPRAIIVKLADLIDNLNVFLNFLTVFYTLIGKRRQKTQMNTERNYHRNSKNPIFFIL